jgi:hypothetical protein
MSPAIKKLLEQVESWPQEDQEELAEAAREIEARRHGVYQLTHDERAAIAEGLADARAGRFASDDEINAIFERARSSRS